MAKLTRECCECRAGEHDNYDVDVRLVYVRDPDTKRIVRRGYICGQHRKAYDLDGYLVVEIPNRPRGQGEGEMENDKAYVVKFDFSRYRFPFRFWRVWQPWKRPHLTGYYRTQLYAERAAARLNVEHGAI